jgi:hypothetical protein
MYSIYIYLYISRSISIYIHKCTRAHTHTHTHTLEKEFSGFSDGEEFSGFSDGEEFNAISGLGKVFHKIHGVNRHPRPSSPQHGKQLARFWCACLGVGGWKRGVIMRRRTRKFY